MTDALNIRRRLRAVRRPSGFTTLFTVYYILTLIVPNCVLACTEPYSGWTVEALILMPLGFYRMWSVAIRRSGIMVWISLPFIIFFCAFQIVLLYLFGNSIIATDMFINLLTTNPGEASELLSNIYPAVILVGAIYVPLLWFAAREIGHKRYISWRVRKIIGASGVAIFVIGALALWPAYHVSENKHVLRDEIFPLNVMYNMGLSGSEFRKSVNYDRTSRDFTFDATHQKHVAGREIYIYIIGEASRALSWQLYGYGKATNPRLKSRDDIILFEDVLTQSNTTHKSVPLMLSSIATDQHEELYRRRGLPALFNEAGFETWFISNQSPQGAMIDHLSDDARHKVYVGSPRYDMQLLDEVRKAVNTSSADRMFIILHCYGSHFSYHQRYPREFAHFKPDNDVAIRPENRTMLRNAYDNSVLYTDHFLAEMIAYLHSLSECTTAMLYCSDHGEDLIDDERERFLHASPTTTAYQLWVASLAWFSDNYRKEFPEKVAAAHDNSPAPTSTHAMFHTVADMASVESPYIDRSVSLVSRDFDHTAGRFYLNDHNEAVPHASTGLSESDMELLKGFGIEL